MDPWPPPAPRRGRGGVLGGLSQRSRSYVGAVLALLVAACVMMLDPGDAGSRFRSLVGLDDDRRVAAVPFSGEGSYAFFATQPGGTQPVGWDPCRPIRYVVNPEGAPDGWEELIAEGVGTVGDAAGLELVSEGTTDDRDFEERRGSTGLGESFGGGFGDGDPVLIGWATEDEVAGLAGDVAGLAGPVSRGVGGYRRYVSGMVVLDAETYDELDSVVGGRQQQRAILMHELAHVLGLAHVEDEGELMYRANIGRTDFGPGDLTGLALLGRVPCG